MKKEWDDCVICKKHELSTCAVLLFGLRNDHCTDCEGKPGKVGSRDRKKQEFQEMRINKTVRSLIYSN